MTQETILQETDDGELFFTIPEDMMERLGWVEGDDLEFVVCEQNTFMLRKLVAHSDEWRYNDNITQQKDNMQMTHSEILKQPNGKVSRLLTLLKLDNIRSSAQNKADVIAETMNPHDQLEMMHKRWFQELADQADRVITELNAASEDDV